MNLKRVKISDMLFFQEGPGVRNTQYTSEGVKLLNVANLVNGELDLNTSDRYISEDEAYGKYKHFLVDAGDFIIASSGIKVEYFDKKMGFAKKEHLPLCMNTSTIRFKVLDKEQLNIKYFMYFMKSKDFKRQLFREITGSAQLNFGPVHLKKMDFPMPEIKEQETIVLTLSKAQVIIEKRKKQLEQLDLLIKARFVEMFKNDKYPKVKASEICDFITKGTTPPMGEIYDENSDTRVPYLKVYNLSFTGELLFDENPQFIERVIHEGMLSRSKVYPNDVLMNIVGPPLGKFSIISNEYPELNINQAIAIFRAKEKVLPRYLLSALMQPEVLRPFIDQAVGIRQQNLNLEQCRNLVVSLPDLELQREFVVFSEKVDKSKFKIQKSLDEAQLLFDSLMQKYFG